MATAKPSDDVLDAAVSMFFVKDKLANVLLNATGLRHLGEAKQTLRTQDGQLYRLAFVPTTEEEEQERNAKRKTLIELSTGYHSVCVLKDAVLEKTLNRHATMAQAAGDWIQATSIMVDDIQKDLVQLERAKFEYEKQCVQYVKELPVTVNRLHLFNALCALSD